ncbi:CBS domain-containing protein [Falsiroseomonas bella]|uniref:CBS domain-containing protein n=1 Tax=Falsiroseomonas bella TaxID=2184016 RepID=A0A317FE26_9PROT|nr:CBS domain-containing protein [Falsiroseomonas bella]PWS36793.1 CBS domain-containing protein [Falsiroseomonas bella]
MTIAAVLKQKGNAVISVTPDTPVAEVARVIAQRRIGAVMVLDARGGVLGIVSERDIVRALATRANGIEGQRAEDLMTREVVMVGPHTPVDTALRVMDEHYFRHLPVVDGSGRLLGLVSVRDLVRHRIAQQEQAVESLTHYVTRSYMH